MAPGQVDPVSLRRAILAVPGVADVHELHVWQLGSNDATAVGTAHVVFSSTKRVTHVLGQVKAVFHEFNVHTTTIEPGA